MKRKTLPLLAVTTLLLTPALPAQANDIDPSEGLKSPREIGLADLQSIKQTEASDTTLKLADGRVFAIPAPGWEVSSESLVTEESALVEDVLIVTTNFGEVAVQIGTEQYGSRSALSRLNEIEKLFETGTPQALEQQFPGISTDATQPIKCRSWDSVMLGHGWSNRNIEWQYNPAKQPGTNSAATLERASKRWKGKLTDPCGSYTATSKLRTTYKGTTTRAPLNNSTGGCAAWKKALNTKGWGTLPSGTLANACTYSMGAAPLRSDHKYSTRYAWNTGSSTTCSGSKYDLQGVATHEFGHTYGLGHSRQENNQVMKPSSGVCESSQRALGKGDIRGITYLYG